MGNKASSVSNFSRKTNKIYHSPPIFNNSTVTQTRSQKYLCDILDSRLTFSDHLNSALSKTNKAIELLRKLQNIFSRTSIGDYI